MKRVIKKGSNQWVQLSEWLDCSSIILFSGSSYCVLFIPRKLKFYALYGFSILIWLEVMNNRNSNINKYYHFHFYTKSSSFSQRGTSLCFIGFPILFDSFLVEIKKMTSRLSFLFSLILAYFPQNNFRFQLRTNT